MCLCQTLAGFVQKLTTGGLPKERFRSGLKWPVTVVILGGGLCPAPDVNRLV